MIMVPDSKSLQIRIEDGNVSVDGDNLSDEQKAEIKAHIEQELEMQHGLSSATAVWAVPADAEEKRQLELELSAAGAGALALSPEQLKELEGLKTLRIEGPDGKELLMELESLNGAPGLATTLQPGELAQIELEAARAGELSGQVLSDEELAELSGLTVTLAPDAELAQCELRQGLAIAGDGQGLGLALDGLAVRPGSAELAAELEKLSAALAGLAQSGDKAELESLIEELNDVLEDYTSESDDEDNSDS